MSIARAEVEEKIITGEELFEMGDIGPAELIYGRIVPMSPTGGLHAYLENEAGTELGLFVKRRDLGWVLVGEVGIYTRRNRDRIRAADVVFISKTRMSELPPGYLQVAPELVIEILSPTDRWLDIRQKLTEYFAIGVERVWIVEADHRLVLVYRSPKEFDEFGMGDTLRGEGVLAGFELPVARLFGEERQETRD